MLRGVFKRMKKEVLSNGLTIIFEPKKVNSVVVEIMVKVGSNDESPSERGLTHFIEHLVFEGTKKRPTNRDISNEIEKIGGEFNAYTTNERTCFHVKVVKKHFSTAVEVLADILQNPLFKPEHITREKNVVLKEIDMVFDDPRFYQWVLLQSTLFQKNPARYPTYGDKNIIKKLTREKIVNYFYKHYVPNNMVITVVGDIKGWKKEIEKAFCFKRGILHTSPRIKEPFATKNITKTEKKNIANTYVSIGFNTVTKGHPDSYALEVINGILGRGQSGKLFTEIRTNRGLAYDLGTQNVNEISFGYFAIFASVDKKNALLVKSLMLKELEKLLSVTKLEVQEAKDFVEGAYYLELEESQKIADQLLAFEQAGDANMLKDYIRQVKEVTVTDVKRVIKRYFNHYAFVMLQGK